MATQEQTTQVLQLYTAYFNRAADKAGVDYWLNEMLNNGWTINDVALTFSQQVEYTNLYTGLSHTQIVAQVYINVLNRSADAAGATYWSGELSNGNIGVSQLVQAVITAATETDEDGDFRNPNDALLFNNKINVSNYAYSVGSNFTNISLATISTDENTVNSLKNQIDTSILVSDNASEISDSLNVYDTSLWMKSEGWSNGGVFANSWEEEQIIFSNGIMQLKLKDVDGTLVSGEYQSNATYGHGYYEVSLKASGVAGTINGFFTYTGPSEGTPHDEIDVEIKGDNPSLMQVNYWTNGVEHPVVIDLGFDASIAFHSYGFSWQANKIEWYVDGLLVHTEDGSRGALPTHPAKIITNLWGSNGAGVWSSDYDVSNGEAVLEVTHISYSSDLMHIETANNNILKEGVSEDIFVLDSDNGNTAGSIDAIQIVILGIS